MLNIRFIRENPEVGKIALKFIGVGLVVAVLLIVAAVGTWFWASEIKPIAEVERISKEKALEESISFEKKPVPQSWPVYETDGWIIAYPPNFEVKELSSLTEGGESILVAGSLPERGRVSVTVNSEELEVVLLEGLFQTIRERWGLEGVDMFLAVQRLGVVKSPDSYPEGLSHIVIDRKIDIGGRTAAQFGVREKDSTFVLRTSFIDETQIVDITTFLDSLDEGERELLEVYNTLISSFSFK